MDQGEEKQGPVAAVQCRGKPAIQEKIHQPDGHDQEHQTYKAEKEGGEKVREMKARIEIEALQNQVHPPPAEMTYIDNGVENPGA